MAEERNLGKSGTSGAQVWVPKPWRACRARIFTAQEKRLLGRGIFENFALNAVDFSGADLRHARFVRMFLRGCDFSGSDLRGTEFIECDLREANFARAVFGGNRSFESSCFMNAMGLSDRVRSYVTGKGGSFWCC